MTQVVILASGRGSGFRALMESVKAGRLKAKVLSLVCDVAGAKVIEIAKEFQVPVLLLPRKEKESKESYGERLLAALPKEARFLVLSGFFQILSRQFLEAFRDPKGYSRVVNIHPSLLPAFPGLHAYQKAFEHGCKQAGVTIHFVDHEMDSGPILAQEAFSIEDCKSVEEVEERGLKLEHKLYSETLSWVFSENFKVEKSNESGRLHVRQN